MLLLLNQLGEISQKSNSAVKMKIMRAKEKFVKIHNANFTD